MQQDDQIYSGPLRAAFALTPEDVKAALRLSGRLQNRVGLHLFQSALAVLGLAVFVSSIIANPGNLLNYFLSGLCLLLLLLIWVYPLFSEKQAVKKTVDGRQIEVELEPCRVHVCIPESGMDDTFLLSETSPVRQDNRIFLLELPGGAMLVLPKRALPEGSLAAAGEILKAAGKECAEETAEPPSLPETAEAEEEE